MCVLCFHFRKRDGAVVGSQHRSLTPLQISHLDSQGTGCTILCPGVSLQIVTLNLVLLSSQGHKRRKRSRILTLPFFESDVPNLHIGQGQKSLRLFVLSEISLGAGSPESPQRAWEADVSAIANPPHRELHRKRCIERISAKSVIFVLDLRRLSCWLGVKTMIFSRHPS